MRIWHKSFSDLDRVPVYRATLGDHAAKVLPAGDRVTLHGLCLGTNRRRGLDPTPLSRAAISAQSLKMNCLLAGDEMANLLQKRVLFLGTIQKTD